jgi:membrane-bound ClpP family serine protease
MTPGWTYFVVNAIDWLLLSVLAWMAVRWTEVSASLAALLVGLWVLKDILLFPSARRYYESQPAERRIVGEQGQALGRIDPSGFARVRGEIWQVHIAPGAQAILEGEQIRVRDIEGLRLLVEATATHGQQQRSSAR